MDQRMRELLLQLHRKLLHFHKALLDSEREAYQREHGVVNNAQFLQLAINDQNFHWLRAISQLIVSIDEMTELEEAEVTSAQVEALLNQTRALVSPPDDGSEFSQRYHAALKREPAAATHHTELVQLLQKAN